jgi:hypothetical protein
MWWTDKLDKLYQRTNNDFFAKFRLKDDGINSCAVVPIGNANWPSSVAGNAPIMTNIPLAVGAIIALIASIVSKISTVPTAQEEIAKSSKKAGHKKKKGAEKDERTSGEQASGEQASREVAMQKDVPLSAQMPSIYDIFRAAQFIITNALLSLTCLPISFRDLSSKISWFSALAGSGSSINSELSSIADDKIRGNICNMAVYGCYKLLSDNRNVTTMCNPEYDPPLSGVSTFGQLFNVPGYNLFFMVLTMFCIVLGCVMAAGLLVGLLTRASKGLWERWPILKAIWKNLHFLAVGKQKKKLT